MTGVSFWAAMQSQCHTLRATLFENPVSAIEVQRREREKRAGYRYTSFAEMAIKKFGKKLGFNKVQSTFEGSPDLKRPKHVEEPLDCFRHVLTFVCKSCSIQFSPLYI